MFFFYFHNFKYQGSINVSVKFITNYMLSNGFGEKVDFDGFAIFSNGGHLGFLT